jgi:hypothetical protein
LLVLKRCEDQPIEILPLAEIVSILLTNTEPKVLIDQMQQRLKATPFVPFYIVLLHGNCYTVGRSQDVLITSDSLYVAQGRGGSEVHENVCEIPLTWIDHFETLPS